MPICHHTWQKKAREIYLFPVDNLQNQNVDEINNYESLVSFSISEKKKKGAQFD